MNKTSLLLILSLIVSMSTLSATFDVTFGGSEIDQGRDVQQTADGGYIFVGSSVSYGPGYWDVWIVKTDENGELEWENSFGGANRESGKSVLLTEDGGYLIGASTESYGAGGYDVWLIKLNSEGTLEWQQTYGGTGRDVLQAAQKTNDGGYVFIAESDSFGAGGDDFWFVKVDAFGTELWNHTFGGTDTDSPYAVQQTTDSGYILSGLTESFGAGYRDMWLIKTDSAGIEEWNTTYGGAEADIAFDAIQTSDGGYLLAGETDSYGSGDYDVWLVKTDESGVEEWQSIFGGVESDKAFGVTEVSTGGYTLIGFTWSFGAGQSDVWLINTDENGEEVWQTTLGGSSSDSGRRVRETPDGGYILAASTYSYGVGNMDYWLIKTNSTGGMTEEPQIPIEVDTPQFVVELEEGETVSDQFTLFNTSDEAVEYSVDVDYEDGSDWLNIATTSNILDGGESDIIELLFDTTNLTIGTYNCEIDITVPGFELTIPVSLTVNEVTSIDNQVALQPQLLGNYPNP
ncbi:MAG: hypothetical protein B6226_04650, partial [Candidatus Cloacimonetes bacterium 4572_65]